MVINSSSFLFFRRKNIFFTVVFFVGLLFCGLSTAAESERYIFDPQKLYIVDGDSINYGELRFRLCGINAPEREHFLYNWTTNNLRELLKQRKNIVAHVVDIDKYDRKVVVLFIQGEKESLNEKMVKRGAAWHFRRYSAGCEPLIKIRDLNKAEKQARRQEIGVWR